MQIVFLDIDGVLNATTDDFDPSVEMWSAGWLDEKLVARLSLLVATGGAKVVISSSWRQRRTLDELRQIFAERGFVGEILDVTPRHGKPLDGDERPVRSAEIAEWLERHPEVGRYVILDDNHDFGALAPRHVATDSRVGLTDDDVRRARVILESMPVRILG